MTSNDRLNIRAESYIRDLTCLDDEEKRMLMKRAFCQSVFYESWEQFQKYIDGKKVEIILYGKMKPDPKAMDFGSWE